MWVYIYLYVCVSTVDVYVHISLFLCQYCWCVCTYLSMSISINITCSWCRLHLSHDSWLFLIWWWVSNSYLTNCWYRLQLTNRLTTAPYMYITWCKQCSCFTTFRKLEARQYLPRDNQRNLITIQQVVREMKFRDQPFWSELSITTWLFVSNPINNKFGLTTIIRYWLEKE